MATERWDCKTNTKVEDARADAFMAEIEAVCRKHGLSITHEDHEGGFMIDAFNESYMEWLNNAMLGNTFHRDTI